MTDTTTGPGTEEDHSANALALAFQRLTTDPNFKPAARPLDGMSQNLAIYSSAGDTGELIGVCTWHDIGLAFAAAHDLIVLEGRSIDEDGNVTPTVGGQREIELAELNQKRANLAAEMATVDAAIANL